MTKEIQPPLPCCEKYFKDEGFPQQTGVTTGRYDSKEHNESTPPSPRQGDPNQIDMFADLDGNRLLPNSNGNGTLPS